MYASGLLISCATPAASVPTVSMRSAIAMRANTSRRSVTSLAHDDVRGLAVEVEPDAFRLDTIALPSRATSALRPSASRPCRRCAGRVPARGVAIVGMDEVEHLTADDLVAAVVPEHRDRRRVDVDVASVAVYERRHRRTFDQRAKVRLRCD